MRLALCLAVALMTAGLGGLGLGFQQPERKVEAATEVGPRFRAIDIYVDSGEVALAAYQVEIKAADHTPEVPPTSSSTSTTTFTSYEGSIVTLVGISGGDHAAFRDPPRYDPAALHKERLKDRIILAAFNTGADLPTGRTRVAQIQVQVEGPDPVYTVMVKAAAAADGTKINATATAALAGDSR